MKRIKWMLLTVMLFALTACSGGGGGGTETPASESSSNWDELVWDQSNWSDQ